MALLDALFRFEFCIVQLNLIRRVLITGSFEAPEHIPLDDLRTIELGYGISTTINERNDGDVSVYLNSPHTKNQCHSK